MMYIVSFIHDLITSGSTFFMGPPCDFHVAMMWHFFLWIQSVLLEATISRFSFIRVCVCLPWGWYILYWHFTNCKYSLILDSFLPCVASCYLIHNVFRPLNLLLISHIRGHVVQLAMTLPTFEIDNPKENLCMIRIMPPCASPWTSLLVPSFPNSLRPLSSSIHPKIDPPPSI